MAWTLRKKYTLFLIIGTLLLLVTLLILWQRFPFLKTEWLITKTVRAQGIPLNSLHLDQLTSSDTTLSHIQIGDEPPFTIGQLEASYSWPEILQGRLQQLRASGLDVTLYQKDDEWQIGGLETFLTSSTHKTTSSLDAWFQTDSVRQQIPATQIDAAGTLHLEIPKHTLSIPFTTHLTTKSAPSLDVILVPLDITSPELSLRTGHTSVHAVLNNDKQQWQLHVQLPDITESNILLDFSPLSITGKGTLTSKEATLSLHLEGTHRSLQADMRLTASLRAPSSGRLLLTRGSMQWHGGTISLASVSIPFTPTKPIRIPIHLENIPLSELLSTISGGQIEGTGRIRGILPILYYPDGHIALDTGRANAIEEGIITVPPSLLAGEHASLQTTRAILENFHYRTLDILVDSKTGTPNIKLVLNGYNPTAIEGRPVKLTVNLKGDLLSLVEQTLASLRSVNSLLDIKEAP